MTAQRYPRNPVLGPTENWWETKAVFNCALAEKDGNIHMLYGVLGDDNISRLGYGSSDDGFDFDRLSVPV